jgi:SAM-dependent methyltransferase
VDQSLFEQFARVERAHWWFQARREIVLQLASHYLPAGAPVLDIGCGTGFFLDALRERYRAWGIDPSPTAVELCRDRGLDQVSLGSAYQLGSLGRDCFAGAFLLDVLEHLDDDTLALGAARDVLAPDGIVIVTVPAYQALWSRHDVVNQHRRRYTRPRLDRLLQRAGFQVVRSSYFNTRLFPLAAGSRLICRALGWDPHLQLRVPPAWINGALARLFEGEKHRLASPRPRSPYPFGLSILAIGRKHER